MESDTIKNLHDKLSPKMGNFLRARKAVEAYDDIDKIRETPLVSRLTTLRSKIYKNRKSPTPSPLIK